MNILFAAVENLISSEVRRWVCNEQGTLVGQIAYLECLLIKTGPKAGPVDCNRTPLRWLIKKRGRVGKFRIHRRSKSAWTQKHYCWQIRRKSITSVSVRLILRNTLHTMQSLLIYFRLGHGPVRCLIYLNRVMGLSLFALHPTVCKQTSARAAGGLWIFFISHTGKKSNRNDRVNNCGDMQKRPINLTQLDVRGRIVRSFFTVI